MTGAVDDMIEFPQFCKIIRMKNVEFQLKAAAMSLEEAEELFFLLDVDNLSKISIDEFIVGCKNLKAMASRQDCIRLISCVECIHRRAEDISTKSDQLIQEMHDFSLVRATVKVFLLK